MGIVVNIDSFDALASTRKKIDLPVGRFSTFKVTYRGTSAAGDDLQLDDLGRISLIRKGHQIQREQGEFYHRYADLKGGFPTLTQATAGANRIDCYMPFGLPEVENTIDIRSKEECDLVFDFPAGLDTAMDSCTVDVIGIEERGIPELYQLHIYEADITRTGASETGEVLSGPNIAALYGEDEDSAIDAITLQVDGLNVVERVDDTHLLEITRANNRVEDAAGGSFFEINLATSGLIQEVLNSNVRITPAFTGAGDLRLTVFRIEFSESNQAASIERARNWLLERGSADMPRFLAEGALAA